MTLVEKDDDWPTRPERDASGLLKSVELGLGEIVAKGVLDWQRTTGRAPTDVILGRKAIEKLRQYLSGIGHIFYGIPQDEWKGEPPINQFMGLIFHRDTEAEGVVLLTREPR